jgi:NADH-quinone oxidoreductase subunit N
MCTMSEVMPVILPILPELFLFGSTLLLLLVGLYGGDKSYITVRWATPVVLLGTLGLILQLDLSTPRILLNGMLRLDGFVQYAQALVLLGSLLVMVLANDWLDYVKEKRFEFPILILLAVLGMLLMIASNDLLALYLGLELTSLSLYVLAAFRRDSLKATEAGIKYFVLGSLASGLLLFGASLVYGFTGSINFVGIATWLSSIPQAGLLAPSQLGALVGLLLLITGFCFKISAVPFHMWTPDVYEGAPTPVTAFFAIAPKVAALTLFSRLLMQPFGDWIEQWQQVIVFVSIGSMLVGAFGALVQKNIKRMLAYSSIGHVGYALMAVAAGTEQGMQGLLVYLSVYTVMSAGAFACVLMMQRNGEYVEEIDALSGLSRKHPYLAAVLAVFIFSLAGIPPLAGFFGKLYVFLAALEAGLLWLAIIGVLSSVVGAYYYLRIVKVMYFDEEKDPLGHQMTKAMKALLAVTSAATLLFIFMPTPLMEAAAKAAKALWL